MKRGRLVIGLIYLLLGLYFVNSGIRFFEVPEQILSFQKWIIFFGGLFLLYSFFQSLNKRRHYV